MSRLEHQDELGLPWDDWADGRVHRLVKGRDFVQTIDVLLEAADNAARRLDKVARTVKEIRFRNSFVWVQFADCEIQLGEPCRCGSYDLRRVSLAYAECGACGATVIVREPKAKREGAPDELEAAGEDGALIASLLGSRPARGRAALRVDEEADEPADVVNPRTDLTRLGAYRRIELFTASKDERRERLYGRAIGPGERSCLLVVDLPLRDGARIEAPGYPGGWLHVVWSSPLDPFGDAISLGRLPSRAPDLHIEDPLATPLAPGGGAPPEAGELVAPPTRLDGYTDVHVASRGGRGQRKNERLFGFGSTLDGEPVLLAVRYRLRDGEPIDDPERAGESLHTVRAVPVEPFGDVVDLAGLRQRVLNPAASGWRRRRASTRRQ